MLYIGSDHGGYKLKEDLKKFLKSRKIAFTDLGAAKLVKDDDYPQYAAKVVKAVQKDLKKNLGILICRSGQGMCIAANKFKGIRAALAWNEQSAKHARRDDDANVLCLPSDYMSPEIAEHVVWSWLNTDFSFEPRHVRRIKEVSKLD
jgi:ribose 5-phosphate isomerase B